MTNNGLVGSFVAGVNLIVNFGGVAKGTGFYGSVLTQNGGRLSPGASPGTVSASHYSANGGGIFVFEISTRSVPRAR